MFLSWEMHWRLITDGLIVYRLNTYPFIHTGFWHALFNAVALTPLLERFEAEHGTLTAVALFVGREYFILLCGVGVMFANGD